jgi:hypothetical protein
MTRIAKGLVSHPVAEIGKGHGQPWRAPWPVVVIAVPTHGIRRDPSWRSGSRTMAMAMATRIHRRGRPTPYRFHRERALPRTRAGPDGSLRERMAEGRLAAPRLARARPGRPLRVRRAGSVVRAVRRWVRGVDRHGRDAGDARGAARPVGDSSGRLPVLRACVLFVCGDGDGDPRVVLVVRNRDRDGCEPGARDAGPVRDRERHAAADPAAPRRRRRFVTICAPVPGDAATEGARRRASAQGPAGSRAARDTKYAGVSPSANSPSVTQA